MTKRPYIPRASRWLAAAAILMAAPLAHAQDVKPPTDPLGVVKIPKGAPIVIGGYWTLSGSETAPIWPTISS